MTNTFDRCLNFYDAGRIMSTSRGRGVRVPGAYSAHPQHILDISSAEPPYKVGRITY